MWRFGTLISSASLCAFLDKPSGIAEFKFDRTEDTLRDNSKSDTSVVDVPLIMSSTFFR